MDDAARSLLDLWDTTGGMLGGLRPDDWQRPLPTPGTDVLDLTMHLTGARYAGPARLRESVAAARGHAADQIAGRVQGDRVLGAWCLDMCLHTHDLGAALGRPVDLDAYPAAAREASRLVLAMAPRLLAAAAGRRDCTLRVQVDGGALDRTVRLVDGTVAPAVADSATDRLDTDAVGLLLLLSGRRSVDDLRAAGTLSWSGEVADAFVRRARLLGAARG